MEHQQHFSEEAVAGFIRELLAVQKLAVLSTVRPDGHPYVTLVAFDWTRDLSRLVFVTPRATRKFEHIQSEPHIALLVDNRSNRPEDFHEAMALTVLGLARECPTEACGRLRELFLERQAALTEFVSSPATALVEVMVERYVLVRQFQNVLELRMTAG